MESLLDTDIPLLDFGDPFPITEDETIDNVLPSTEHSVDQSADDPDSEGAPAFAFLSDAKKRLKEPTVESLKEAIEFYAEELKDLGKIDKAYIKNELQKMEILIPRECFDLSEIQRLYSLVNSHRQRASELYWEVNSYVAQVNIAAEELRKIAIRVGAGARHDKEGYAANVVLRIVKHAATVKPVLDQIAAQLKILEMAGMTLASLLKANESLSRINYGYADSGASVRYQRLGEKSEAISDENRRIRSGGNKFTP